MKSLVNAIKNAWKYRVKIQIIGLNTVKYTFMIEDHWIWSNWDQKLTRFDSILQSMLGLRYIGKHLSRERKIFCYKKTSTCNPINCVNNVFWWLVVEVRLWKKQNHLWNKKRKAMKKNNFSICNYRLWQEECNKQPATSGIGLISKSHKYSQSLLNKILLFQKHRKTKIAFK